MSEKTVRASQSKAAMGITWIRARALKSQWLPELRKTRTRIRPWSRKADRPYVPAGTAVAGRKPEDTDKPIFWR